MDLRKRLSREGIAPESKDRRNLWWRWVLLTTALLLLILLAVPYVSNSNFFGLNCYSERYRPAQAVTGECIPETPAVISISRKGVIRVSSGEEMSLPISSPEELHSFVEYVASTYPERAFFLRIDKDIPYETVDEVLSVLEAADVHEVYFHTVLPNPP